MYGFVKNHLIGMIAASSLAGGTLIGTVSCAAKSEETHDMSCLPSKDLTMFSVSKNAKTNCNVDNRQKCVSNIKEQVKCLSGVDPKTKIRVDSNCTSCPVTKTENFNLGKDEVIFVDKMVVYEKIETPTKQGVPCCQPCQTKGSEECDSPKFLGKYEMLSSQVFFRHGARTPLQHIPNIVEVRFDKDFLLMPVPYTDVPFVVCNLNGGPRPVAALEKKYETIKFCGGMHAGQLTHYGRDQMYCLGQRLRRKYIERWGLLPECFVSDDVYLRSTNINRSIDSLQCVCAGIWGDALKRASPLRFEVAAVNEEMLYPQLRYCKTLRGLEKLGDVMQDEIPGFKRTADIINRQLGLTDKPWFMVYRDNIISRMAHGLHIPEWLDTIAPQIDFIATRVLCYLMAGPPKHRETGLKLAVGPILNLVLTNFEENSKKLRLYSVHDSTLIPMLLSMNSFDNIWPSFGADISFDLLKDRKTGEKVVRVTYCGKVLKIGNCNETIIPYKTFQSILGKYAIAPDKHRAACTNKEFHTVLHEAIKCEREKRNERVCISDEQLRAERERCRALKCDEKMKLDQEQKLLNSKSSKSKPCHRATGCETGCSDCKEK